MADEDARRGQRIEPIVVQAQHVDQDVPVVGAEGGEMAAGSDPGAPGRT